MLLLSAISLAVPALAAVQVLGFSHSDESIALASLSEFLQAFGGRPFVDLSRSRHCRIAGARSRYARSHSSVGGSSLGCVDLHSFGGRIFLALALNSVR